MNSSPAYCRENRGRELPRLCLWLARIRVTRDTGLYNEEQQQLTLSQQRKEKENFNSSPEKKGDVKTGDLETLLTSGKQLAVSNVYRLPGPGYNPHQKPHGQMWLYLFFCTY